MEASIDGRLLRPGWAGELSLEEARFIQGEIQESRELRRQWRFKGEKRVPLSRIAVKAFPENPDYAKTHIRREQAREAAKNARNRANVVLTRI